MKIYRPDLLFLFVLSTGGAAHAQDADHLTTNGVGQSFLAPDAGVPGGLGVLPQNVTIGTAPAFGATLRVRGDQLNVADQFDPPSWCTFRSDIHNGGRQNWSMVRQDNILGYVEVGRLYHGSDFNWFAVQAPQPNRDMPGILWLENAERAVS